MFFVKKKQTNRVKDCALMFVMEMYEQDRIHHKEEETTTEKLK